MPLLSAAAVKHRLAWPNLVKCPHCHCAIAVSIHPSIHPSIHIHQQFSGFLSTKGIPPPALFEDFAKSQRARIHNIIIV
jgi:hypothetical protein